MCPILTALSWAQALGAGGEVECKEERCAWWCDGMKACGISLLGDRSALEALRKLREEESRVE